jgi:hypothetical protein
MATGSERSKRTRATLRLADRVEISIVDLAFCRNCPSCGCAGTIAREQIQGMYGCSPGEASRAVAELQKRGVLGTGKRHQSRQHPGSVKRYLVVKFKDCRTFHEALERMAVSTEAVRHVQKNWRLHAKKTRARS